MMGRYRASLPSCSCSRLERCCRSYRPSLADWMHSRVGSQLVLGVGMEYHLGLLTERRSLLECSFPIQTTRSHLLTTPSHVTLHLPYVAPKMD
jgi:hypothetical protein